MQYLEQIIHNYRQKELFKGLVTSAFYIMEPVFYMGRTEEQIRKQSNTFWLMESVVFFLSKGDMAHSPLEKMINFGILQIPVLMVRYASGLISRYKDNKILRK